MSSLKLLSRGFLMAAEASALAAAIYAQNIDNKTKKRGPRFARSRKRRSVEEVYQCLGPSYFRRAYRMTYEVFWILHAKLQTGILAVLKQSRRKTGVTSRRMKRGCVPPPCTEWCDIKQRPFGVCFTIFCGWLTL